MRVTDKWTSMKLLKHGLFWLAVLLYFMVTADMMYFKAGYIQSFHSMSVIVIPQIITTYTILYILVPRFLNKKKHLLFFISVLLLLMLMFMLYYAIRMYIYQPKYIDYYTEMAKQYASLTYIERITNLEVFISKAVKFLTPAVLMLMVKFYKNQQQFLQLKEQKKTAELTALKNQLNPHFLFNTMNNMYSLALEKSEKTPEVIGRLSDILDYILYRCKDTYVQVDKEIELIENYLALEKVRYGKRVNISFDHQVDQNLKIAPLLLLTFIENAFKHGVKNELNTAEIDINLKSNQTDILFSISNTKPTIPIESQSEKLGLINVRKQLDLLYPNIYDLQITDTADRYDVLLRLKKK